MKAFFIILMLGVFWAVIPQMAVAQETRDSTFLATTPTTPHALGAVSSEPRCFNVVNKAPYTVFGSIRTNFYVRADGMKGRHKSNFRLGPQDDAEFCTYGPFFEGEKIELVLRSLIPVFSCKTALDEDILIYGRHKSGGGTETYAVCL